MTTFTYEWSITSEYEVKQVSTPTFTNTLGQPALLSAEVNKSPVLSFEHVLRLPSLTSIDINRLAKFFSEYTLRTPHSQEEPFSYSAVENIVLTEELSVYTFTYEAISIEDIVSAVKFPTLPSSMKIYVYDAIESRERKKPVSGARIIYSTAVYYTDENGEAEILVIPGEKVRIEKEGYKATEIEAIKGEATVYIHPVFAYTR